MSKIEFCTNCIDTDGKVKYNLIELKIDEDLKVMWRTYHRRLTKGPIEFAVITSRFVNDITNILNHLVVFRFSYLLLFC